MLSMSRTRFLLGLAVLAAVLASAPASRGQAKKPANTKSVTFKTSDGVELSGTFYPNPSGKAEATVLILHDFDLKKGGSTEKEGWPELAADLQKAGYSVLMFDFRGFGDSKNVSASFWNARHNGPHNVARKGGKTPDTVSHTDFRPTYVPYLVNDIAAAKAYLDRQNDQRNCNTSSLVVIGAGESATLGALWMANECRRRKDKNPTAALGVGVPMLGDPESKDLAAGIWLSISPTLGRRNVGVGKWVAEAGRDHKVPMAFVFGKGDTASDNLSRSLEKSIKGGKGAGLQLTGIRPVPGKLVGRALLTKETRDWIVKDYLGKVMEARGNKEWVDRKVETSVYWYTQPKNARPLKINKKPGEEVPPVDLRLFLPVGG